MKLNKSLLVAALALGSFYAGSPALRAQDNTNPPPAAAPPTARRPAQSFEDVAKQLELTDDQKIKAKPIFEDFQKQLAEFRKNNPDASMADRRAKMKEVREAATAKLKEVLTADQLAKWEKLGQRRPNGAGGPPPAAPKN